VGTTQNIPAGQAEHLIPYRFRGMRENLHESSDQPADQQYRFSFGCVGEKAVVPDLHEPMRQNMEQKAADKFRSCKGHRFGLVVITAIFEGESHSAVFNRFYPVIGYGDLVDITAEIGKDLLGTCKGFFGPAGLGSLGPGAWGRAMLTYYIYAVYPCRNSLTIVYIGTFTTKIGNILASILSQLETFASFFDFTTFGS